MVNEDELMIILSKLKEDNYDVLSLVLHKDMLTIIQELAQRQNIGSETLVERWLEEKIKILNDDQQS
jgi:hypothetical protein